MYNIRLLYSHIINIYFHISCLYSDSNLSFFQIVLNSYKNNSVFVKYYFLTLY